MLTTSRIRKLVRNARDYKLTYALIFHLSDVEDVTTGKNDIEHTTRAFKVHCYNLVPKMKKNYGIEILSDAYLGDNC